MNTLLGSIKRGALLRGLGPVSLAALLAVGAGCGGNNNGAGNADTSQNVTPPEPVVTQLYITAGDQGCEIHDADGNTVVTVPRTGVVSWTNQTDEDARLIFSSNQRLFGVIEAVVYAGGTQSFSVRDDAEPGEHTYRGSCRQTLPGPKIIIPPPDDDD